MRITQRAVVFLSSALLVSLSVFAGENNKSTVQFFEKVNVEGKSLNSGNYTVEWNGSGPAVQVTILQGKQTVATFPAHLTERTGPNGQDSISTTAAPDGSRTLTAIYPAHKRVALVIDQNNAGSQQTTGAPASK